ncbi:hypothetical protein LTR17_009324 [Elasticomyces elasticus]|nr:hypothetical protein LTR17_009324 [Elasticomyces elasticus]
MTGIGHMMMYGLGALDLDSLLGSFLGDTQFKKVCAIAAVAMVIAQGISCWAVTERVYVGDATTVQRSDGILTILRQIYSTTMNVPERIQAICMVQFWSWIGWFPFLFYGSTWVGEIYLRHEAPSSGGDALTEVGKAGSAAYLAFAIISFLSSIVLPWLVQNPDQDGSPGYTPRPPQGLQSVVVAVRKNRPTLLTAWMLSCCIFAASMIFAPWNEHFDPHVADPKNILAAEFRRSTDASTLSSHSSHSSPRTLHLRHSSNASAGNTSSTGESSGIYLGILNIYTTLPQFVGTGISWVVFSILEPGKSPELATEAHPDEHHSTEGVSGIAVCLFVGALSALVAAWATRRLKVTN